jgi:hypothetical protein
MVKHLTTLCYIAVVVVGLQEVAAEVQLHVIGLDVNDSESE